MSSFSTLPLVLTNQDFVTMKQITNSATNSGTNLSDTDFENYITYHLAQQTAPVDLSNTDFPRPNSLTISDSSLNGNNVIINNNDTLLVNENFALTVNYKPETIVSYDNYSYSIGGGNHISTNVNLSNTSQSLYDSNFKIDISLNNGLQYTDNQEWSVQFDRNNTGMNYFACINSKLESQNDTSPFYILENSANIYSLGNNPETVQNGGSYYGTHKYFTRDSSNIMVPQNISTNYTLDANFCRSELNNDISANNGSAYTYNNDEFNTFKIIQDQPHVIDRITNYLTGDNVSGSQLPIQYNGSNVGPNTFDISGIFDSSNQNWNEIGAGFQMSVIVGSNQDGGYTVDSYNTTSAFSIDDSNLTRDVANPYMKINVEATDHRLHIENGSVVASSNNGSNNTDFISVGTEAEILGQSFYNVSGEIVIFTKDVNNRVYYPNNGGTNSFSDVSGIKSALTDHVDVYYNGTESGANSTISYEVTQTEDVNYTLSVVSSSTASVVLSSDNRNLAKNNSALLTLVSNNSGVVLDDVSFVLQSNLPTDPSYIQVISIDNQSILTDNKPIVDSSENTVSGSTSSVSVQNIDLEGLNYQDYRVYLTTKTVTDISNLLQLKEGWSVAAADPSHPSMIGNALKTGVIRDDYLFMTNASSGTGQGAGLDISMTYAFEVASPIIASTQAVKHQIAISFLDLASNTAYDVSPTVFYLDDQDITIQDISVNTIEDVSCTNIEQSSLNNGSYLPSSYRFKKFKRTKQFIASFDSKFQFYTNLRFVTPTIYEQSLYYQIYDLSGTQLPSYLLKYFQCNHDGDIQNLSNTHVNLVNGSNGNEETYNTTFKLTQEVTSIFNVELYGSNDNVNYEPVDNTPLAYLDPFFNLKTTINNFDGQNAIGTVSVNFGNNNTVNRSQYYIQADNAPGVNVSFNAARYIYTVGTSDPILNNFTFYNNFYDTLDMTACNVNLEISGNSNVISISDGTGLLAKIIHPSIFIDNYNIVVCSSPLLQVSGNLIDSFYSLAVGNKVKVDDGVYYYINANPSVGSSDTFGLISDSFSLKYVNSGSFDNGSYSSQTLFTSGIINEQLRDPNDYTKSVEFSRLRGYQTVSPKTGTTYYDVITLTRTPSTYSFYLDNISAQNGAVNGQTIYQTFTGGVYKNQVFTVDNISGIPGYPGIVYNLGLNINVDYSILSQDEYNNYEGDYLIDVKVADYVTSIDANPYQSELVNSELNSGLLTDIQSGGNLGGNQKDLFYPYITGVQGACIKSYGQYRLQVQRDVPDLRIYSLINKSFIGNPVAADVSSTVWYYEGSIQYNNFLLNGFTISNLKVRRSAETGIGGYTTGHVVFYNSYYSYFVVAPPSISVYGYPVSKNVTSVPISGTSSFFDTFDIVDSNSYVYTISTGINITLSQPNVYSFADYLYTPNTKYSFNIKGNKISISLYNGGVGNFGEQNGPDTIDSNPSALLERLYRNVCIEDLSNNSYLTVTRDASLNYNIDYKQFIFNTHNSTANIHFSVGNAFTGPNSDNATGNPSYYLRLPVAVGTGASFYQANIIYADVSGNGYYDTSGNYIGHYDLSFGTGYYMIIDRYDTGSNINYNKILQTQTIREFFFPVQSHSTKEIFLGSIVDQFGNVINEQDYLNQIEISDISNASWTLDTSFTLQYVGITLSGLSTSGINAIGDLLRYDPLAFLESKSLYIRRQDAIRMRNILGNTLFRVTNSGNVQTQRVLTSNISLYYPPTSVKPTTNSIAGSSDIITIFAQDTIMD